MRKGDPDNNLVKIVYNACFGGFGLSDEAKELGVEMSKDPSWAEHVVFDEIARHDPILVAVVEQLGRKADGPYAELEITKVAGRYWIDEYDGREAVETSASIPWVQP